MRIEEFIQSPQRAYIKAERYLNNGSNSGIRNTTSSETSPLSKCNSFELISVFLENINFTDFGLNNENLLPNGTIIIHPDLRNSNLFSKCNYQYLKSNIEVIPTASGRTTYDYKNNVFIKLAYLDLLGRIPRHIDVNKIESAIEVTRLLSNVIESKKCNRYFSILKENRGRVAHIPLDKGKKYELGVILREAVPYPYSPKFHALIPFFSLFSKEYIPGSDWVGCEVQDQPLLIQLFEQQKEYKKLDEFMLNVLIKPLYQTYFDALLLGGIELEAHAQNMLIAVDKSLHVIQIVCRDLESAGRDVSLMNHLGITYNEVAKEYKFITRDDTNITEKYSKYQTTHSFMFDFKLGEYIVSNLMECMKSVDKGIDIEKMQKEIKVFNRSIIKKLPDDYFPPEWCTYDNVIWGEGNKKEYNWHANPKYR